MAEMNASRAARVLALTAVASLFGGAALAALWADNEPVSVVADGTFEDAGPVLRLDASAPFPLIAGGWGVRGADAGRVATVKVNGGQLLEIESSGRGAVQAVQDVPLASRAFVLDVTLQRLRGRQQIRLLGNWDRLEGAGAAGVIVELAPAGLAVVTDAGRWQLPVRLPASRRLHLRIVADTRDEQLRVSIDDRLVGVFPGIPATRPSTLILGSAGGPGASLVRYDDVSLLRLTEVELAALRMQLQRQAPASLPAHLDRLTAAAAALRDGAAFLALPEVRAVARDLQREPGAHDTPALRAALALARLLETN